MDEQQKLIGIDIGGTKIAVAAVQALTIMDSIVLPTEAELGFDRAVARITEAILAVIANAGWQPEELRGIGIGCAGPVDPLTGTIHNPYTLPGWDNCDLVTPLHKRFWVPVALENDADAALLGECSVGAGRDCDPVVMLTFGTGVGGAVFAGGRIHRGVAGGHPEIGHIPIDAKGPECYCGIRGCLESIASGTAISEAGKRAGIGDSRAVFAAAARGVPQAVAIVDQAVDAVRIAAWTLIHTFVPQRIVLGGGLMDEHFERIAQPVRDDIRRITQAPKERISVARATLGNHAGLVGAAWLVSGSR